MDKLVVNDRLSIPLDELSFTYSRSAGPGGQNVNKVSTRVTLSFDVSSSPTLLSWEKTLIHQALGRRITIQGILQLHCDIHRSQSGNREEVMARFVALLANALRPKKPRTKTVVPRAERRQRLESKRKRGVVKKLRTTRPDSREE